MTGKGPSPWGRYTSDTSTVPSLARIETSVSTLTAKRSVAIPDLRGAPARHAETRVARGGGQVRDGLWTGRGVAGHGRRLRYNRIRRAGRDRAAGGQYGDPGHGRGRLH